MTPAITPEDRIAASEIIGYMILCKVDAMQDDADLDEINKLMELGRARSIFDSRHDRDLTHADYEVLSEAVDWALADLNDPIEPDPPTGRVAAAKRCQSLLRSCSGWSDRTERQEEAVLLAASAVREASARLDADDTVGLALERMADHMQGLSPIVSEGSSTSD